MKRLTKARLLRCFFQQLNLWEKIRACRLLASGLRERYRQSTQLQNARRDTRTCARVSHCSHFFHSLVAVYVHKVDGEAHAEGMHGFTGNDPQAFSRPQCIASEQTSAAGRATIGDFHSFRKNRPAGQVRDVQPDIGYCIASGTTVRYPTNYIYSVALDHRISIEDCADSDVTNSAGLRIGRGHRYCAGVWVACHWGAVTRPTSKRRGW